MSHYEVAAVLFMSSLAARQAGRDGPLSYLKLFPLSYLTLPRVEQAGGGKVCVHESWNDLDGLFIDSCWQRDWTRYLVLRTGGT